MKNYLVIFLLLNVMSFNCFVLMSDRNENVQGNNGLDLIKKKQQLLHSILQKTRTSFKILYDLISESLKVIESNKKTFESLSGMVCCWKEKFDIYVESLQYQINQLSFQALLHNNQVPHSIPLTIPGETNGPCCSLYQILMEQYNNLNQEYLSLTTTYSNLQLIYSSEKQETEKYLLEFENMLSNLIQKAEQNNNNMKTMFEEALRLVLVSLSNQNHLLDELEELCDG